MGDVLLGQKGMVSIPILVVTMVQVPLLVVNPGARGSVLHAGQKHTDAQATETVLITKVEFPVQERRTSQKVPRKIGKFKMIPILR